MDELLALRKEYRDAFLHSECDSLEEIEAAAAYAAINRALDILGIAY